MTNLRLNMYIVDCKNVDTKYKNMCESFDSSDDEEPDSYMNAAARLKILKDRDPQTVRKKEVQKSTLINPLYSSDSAPLDKEKFTNISRNSEFIENVVRPIRSTRSSSQHVELVKNLILPTNEPLQTEEDFTQESDHNSFNDSIGLENHSTVEIDDYLMEIKVRWKSGKIERIKLGKKEKLANIFKYFAKLENIPENQILLTKGDVLVNPNDTPASMNLQIIDILEGGIVDAVYARQMESTEEMCKVKIQCSSSLRQQLTFNLGRNDPFQKLIDFCAKEKNVPQQKIRLFFDGERISSLDTPDSLDLDEEACIEMII